MDILTPLEVGESLYRLQKMDLVGDFAASIGFDKPTVQLLESGWC